MNGNSVPKDFDRIVSFYHQHYANIIDRLFRENGYEIVKETPAAEAAAGVPETTSTDPVSA
jgi:hypothetical protein